MKNDELTPDEFARIEAAYLAALEKRNRMIVAEARKGTQQAVADKWGINYSRVSKIIKRMMEKKAGNNGKSP